MHNSPPSTSATAAAPRDLLLWLSPSVPLLSRQRALFSGASVPLVSRRHVSWCTPSMVGTDPGAVQTNPVKHLPPTPQDAPIHQETVPSRAYETFDQLPVPQSVTVSGTLPYYLHDHVYYSVGPGVFEATHSDGVMWKAEHPLEGIGMISSFRFNVFKSSVTFRSRISSPRFLEAIQRTPSSEFRMTRMSESRKPLWQLLLEWRPPTIDFELFLSYANYVVLCEYIPGKGFCARTDYPSAQLIDPVTLAPIRQFRFSELHPKLGGTASMAHGMYDDSTGEYLNVVWNTIPRKTDYHVFCTNKDGHTTILATVRERSYYMHSGCMTQNYFIIVLVPLRLSMWDMVLSGHVGNALDVVRGEPVKFIVISRTRGGVVGTFTHRNFSAMHSVNAFESGEDIVLDLCSVQSVKDGFACYERTGNKRMFNNSNIVRFVLPNVKAAAGGDTFLERAKSETLLENAGDFAAVSPHFARKKHRYVYTTISSEGVMSGRLQKSDMQTGQVKRFGLRNCVFGEAVFLPDPSGHAEDDGSIIALALDTVTRKSVIVVLDARTFEEVARAELGVGVPSGIHACMRHRKISV